MQIFSHYVVFLIMTSKAIVDIACYKEVASLGHDINVDRVRDGAYVDRSEN